MDPLKNLEYQENRAEAGKILAKRFVPLIMGFAWITALEIFTTVEPRRMTRDTSSQITHDAPTNSSTSRNQTTPEQQAIQIQKFLQDLSFLGHIMSCLLYTSDAADE